MFANMWHWLLSLLYIQVNSLLTCMCAEEEWQSYAKKRKSLRVTSPRGLQRSTYFVSLPLRYGLPFQVAFPLAHWTLSQGVFLIVTQGFWQGDAEYDGTSSLPFLAFSFWPIFTSMSKSFPSAGVSPEAADNYQPNSYPDRNWHHFWRGGYLHEKASQRHANGCNL